MDLQPLLVSLIANLISDLASEVRRRGSRKLGYWLIDTNRDEFDSLNSALDRALAETRLQTDSEKFQQFLIFLNGAQVKAQLGEELLRQAFAHPEGITALPPSLDALFPGELREVVLVFVSSFQQRLWSTPPFDKLLYAQAAQQQLSAATASLELTKNIETDLEVNADIPGGGSYKQYDLEPIKVSRPLRIFLSYSKLDKLSARRLYEQLHAGGYDIFFDEENLLPGQDWEWEIQKEIRNRDIVMILLSKNIASTAGFIHKEIKYALDVADEQPEGTIFVIPVKIEECEVPQRLRRWQWMDLSDSSAFTQLERALEQRAKAIGIWN